MLVMLPKAADSAEVDALMKSIASSFRASVGSGAITRSVGALMGPGAHAGAASWVLEADFDTLENALSALDAEDFQDIKAEAEKLTTTLFLFEIAAV
jgi:hypothetical protein